MSSYDRSANRKEKKGKKKDGGQQPARKRKGESMFAIFGRLKRALKSDGAQFVAKSAFGQTKKMAGGGLSEAEAALRQLARDGVSGVYGPEVVRRAREAVKELDRLYKPAGKAVGSGPDLGSGHACSSCPDCGVDDEVRGLYKVE